MLSNNTFFDVFVDMWSMVVNVEGRLVEYLCDVQNALICLILLWVLAASGGLQDESC